MVSQYLLFETSPKLKLGGSNLGVMPVILALSFSFFVPGLIHTGEGDDTTLECLFLFLLFLWRTACIRLHWE